MNGGAPDATILTGGCAILETSRAGGLPLRLLGPNETDEDISDPTVNQGQDKMLNRWLRLIEAGGVGGGAVLSTDYNLGTSAADQTLTLSDANGGQLIIDGSGGGFTGNTLLQLLGPGPVTAFEVLTDGSMAVGGGIMIGQVGAGASSAGAGCIALGPNAAASGSNDSVIGHGYTDGVGTDNILIASGGSITSNTVGQNTACGAFSTITASDYAVAINGHVTASDYAIAIGQDSYVLSGSYNAVAIHGVVYDSAPGAVAIEGVVSSGAAESVTIHGSIGAGSNYGIAIEGNVGAGVYAAIASTSMAPSFLAITSQILLLLVLRAPACFGGVPAVGAEFAPTAEREPVTGNSRTGHARARRVNRTVGRRYSLGRATPKRGIWPTSDPNTQVNTSRRERQRSEADPNKYWTIGA